jgi:hypothetical protein
MKKSYAAPQPFAEGPAPYIELRPVKSSQVKSVGYDPQTKTLAVTFVHSTAGAIYHYPNVEQATFDAFMASDSAGSFFGQHIKLLPFVKYRGEAVAA